MNFICPKCRAALFATESGAARCENGHSYDKGREGYYNLLLGSGGGTHGDNKEMVLARRDFLRTGAYLTLAERVAAIARERTQGGVLLDIGCGEGYYTEIIAGALKTSDFSVAVCGFDISKDAVRRAAKRLDDGEFAVASAYKMPIADSSIDTAVNMFSPLALDETRRILRTGGTFIMAIPGRRHLFGLKSALYDEPYENEVQDSHLDGFVLLKEERLSYEIELSSKEEIASLFMMTPYAYRTKREDRERIFTLDSLKTEVEFVVFTYKKE